MFHDFLFHVVSKGLLWLKTVELTQNIIERPVNKVKNLLELTSVREHTFLTFLTVSQKGKKEMGNV